MGESGRKNCLFLRIINLMEESEEKQLLGVLQPPHGVLMKDLPGVPSMLVALMLRVVQLLFASIALAVITFTNDFTTRLFCKVWSVVLAIVDIYALMVRRHLHNRRAIRPIVGGITFFAACASAGVTMFIANLSMCYKVQCSAFKYAIAMPCSWFLLHQRVY
ncbi:hypothetical protein EJB05_23588, partial [Eragrostis curvula]